MTNPEYIQWQAFFAYRNAEREKAARKAEAQQRARRRG